MHPHSWLKARQDFKQIIKQAADVEEDKAYALLRFLTTLVDNEGSFANSDGETIRIGDHIYVVGGAVRNFIIGQPVKDIDIVIDAIKLSTRRVKRDAKWLASAIIRSASPTADINQESNDYGVEILHVHGEWIVNGIDLHGQDIEIAFARKESYAHGGWKPEDVEKATIEEDARRREFTFNTLLWSFADLNDTGPSEEIIKDPLGMGLKDLKDNVIDTPLDPKQTFEDDASRMMRAMKFQFKYGFDLSPRVQEAISNNPELLKNVPVEILHVLLTTTILNQPTYKQALEEMHQNNMLSELIKIFDSNEPFRTSVKNWVEKNRDLVYLFDVLDYGFPIGDKIKFLSDDQKEQLRSQVLSMSKERQERYLESLKNVGTAIKDKSFFIKAFNLIKDEAGLSQREIPLFRAGFYGVVSKDLLLNDPNLMDNPEELKKLILEKIKDLVNKGSNDLESSEASSDIIKKLIKLSFELGKLGKFSETNFLNNHIIKLSEEKDDLFDIKDSSASEVFTPDGQLDVASMGGSNVKSIKAGSTHVGSFRKKAAESLVENPLDIPVPQLSGEVYIFDMDDTLFWTPEWHTIVETNEEGDATSVDMNLPNMFHKAISFVQKANENHVELIKKDKKGREIQELIDSYKQEVGSLRLIKNVVDLPMLGKDRQVVFVLSDESGSPVNISVLKKYFSSKNLKPFDLRGKYVPDQAVVAGDAMFYQSPKTLGVMPNEEILSTYKAHSDNAVILTARETMEGMAEGIMDRLIGAGLKLPISIFTKPTNISSGKYKAHIIGQIAQQDSVNSIKFYDDNLKYINDVNNILENVYGSDIHSKVTIYRVNVSAKPEESLRVKASNDKISILKKLVTVANELDNRGLVKEAAFLDKILKVN